MNPDHTDPAVDDDEGQDDPFAGLTEQATALEGDAQTAASERAQEQAASAVEAIARELAEALTMVRELAAPMVSWWPEYRATWTDAALSNIATAGAAIMQRHGWTMGEAWAALGPYIALIGAALPPSLVTWQAVRARRAQIEHEKRQAQGARAVPSMPPMEAAA